jgi:hypothetical protein
MPAYSVSCRGDLSGGAITHLRQAGMYQHAERDAGIAGGEGLIRHFLKIEAGSPEDAVLVARGALAVAGGEATDYQVEDAPPQE